MKRRVKRRFKKTKLQRFAKKCHRMYQSIADRYPDTKKKVESDNRDHSDYLNSRCGLTVITKPGVKNKVIGRKIQAETAESPGNLLSKTLDHRRENY